jgi:universal stress protein A
MIKFKKVLFPTDFSLSASHALDYAVSLAIEHEAGIVLLHVIEDIPFNTSFTLTSFPTIIEYHHGMEERVKAELEREISPRLKRLLNVDEAVVKGRPYQEIIRVAREKDVDLIVIPAHREGKSRHRYVGSTTERVVSQASCPVLVIHQPEVEPLTARLSPAAEETGDRSSGEAA